MTEHPLIENYRETLLGRLKLKLFAEIVGKSNSVPTHRQMLRFLLAGWRENALAAELSTDILLATQPHRYRKSELPVVKPTLRNDDLTRVPQRPIFAEVRGKQNGKKINLGLLVVNARRTNEIRNFMVFVLEEAAFPDRLAGFYHVFLDPTGINLSKRDRRRHRSLNVKAALRDGLAVLILSVLLQLSKENSPKKVKIAEIKKLSPIASPPTDQQLTRLLTQAGQGKVPLTKGRVPFSLVRPHSIDHCLRVSACLIDAEVGHAMLVYWSGSAFVMSDDYAVYLTHRKKKSSNVEVVVIGSFPAELAEVEAVGGMELLPPVGIARTPDYSKLSPELKEQLLDQELGVERKGYKSAKLIGLYIQLADLLLAHVAESEIHTFLKSNPIAIDAYGSLLRSEVRLGSRYRVDLALQTTETTRRLVLIELEIADVSLFTRAGRPTVKLTHAVQQVEDWLRWWDENPASVPKPFDRRIRPNGWVIMGRGIGVAEDDKRRLAGLNSNRRVQVLTYDDLLDQLQGLIESVEGYRADED